MSATDCHALRMLLGAYVLGGLEPPEAESVRAHLSACTACAAEHTRLAPLPGRGIRCTGPGVAYRRQAEKIDRHVEDYRQSPSAGQADRRGDVISRCFR